MSLLEPREQAERLLDRCRNKLSGGEILALERVVRRNRDEPVYGCGVSSDGGRTHTTDYMLTRLCTEFAEHLK